MFFIGFLGPLELFRAIFGLLVEFRATWKLSDYSGVYQAYFWAICAIFWGYFGVIMDAQGNFGAFCRYILHLRSR